VANYNVDISVAIKNTNKLTAFNKQLDKTAETAERARKGLREIGQTANTNVATLNNLSAALSKAKSEFRDTVLGTKASVLAARDLATAERMVNKELKERTALMNKFRFQGGGSPFKSFSQRADQITSPNVLTVAQQKAIDRNNRKRGITTTPFGPQQMVNQPFEAVSLTSPQAIRDRIINRRAARFAATGTASSFPKSVREESEKRGFLAFSKAASKIQKDTKNISGFTKKSSQILSQQATRDAFEAPMIPPAQKRLTLPERLGIGRRANPRGMFASQTGVSGRIKGGLQSGLIGGGFPLLFGQGGLGAAAGGIGGLAGGALSPGFGFAGSIVATAAAQEIQKIIDFRKAIKELNVELQNQGINTKITRTQIKQLAKDLKITKEEAIQVAKEFGKFQDVGGLNLARIFGDRATFDATVGLNDFSSTLNRIQTLSEKLTLGQEFEAYKILSTEGSEAANEFIKNSLLASEQSERFTTRFEKDLKKFEDVGVSSIRNVFGKLNDLQIQTFLGEDFQKVIRQIMKDDEEIQKILSDPTNTRDGLISVEAKGQIDVRLKEILGDTLLLQQALNKLPAEFDLSTVKAKELVDALSANVENLMFLEEFKAPEEELKKLEKAQRIIIDVSKEMKLGFEDAFKGIVKGTMTVSDAFRSMLNRISDYFLDLAAQIFALGLQKSFLGLFQNLFNIQMPSISGMADGGRVTGGRPYIVGERGPELFTPGVGGSITPNEALGGGSTNIVVNVDASGSNVEGDEDEGRALGIALSAAIETELIKQKRPGGLLA